MSKNEKLLISEDLFKKQKIAHNIDLCPEKEYSKHVLVGPTSVSNINLDSKIKFIITTGRNEYLSFPQPYQLIADITTTKMTQTHVDAAVGPPVVDAHMKDNWSLLDNDDNCKWVPTTSLLSLFDEIDFMLQIIYKE